MANAKISALPAATTPLAGTELVPIVQDGVTDQVTIANLTAGRAVATGALTVTGAGAISGDVAVNTDKFTVAASSGNTVVAGTLGVTSNLAVATNKFTVAAASGNTAVAGTLGITGLTTLTGGVAGGVQSLSGPGAVNLTTVTTAFTSTGTGDALTLADGVAGQLKTVVYLAEGAGGDTGILTPTNRLGFASITLNAIGDSVTLQFIGTAWAILAVNGATVA